MLGLVVTNLANPFYSQLALGVDWVASQQGLKVVLSNSRDDVEAERQIVNDLAERRLLGIIVVPADREQRHLEPARLSGLPIVFAARPPVDVAVDCVLVDDYGGAREATEFLLAQGHRRIAFLGPPAAWTSAERLRGFSSVLREAGLEIDERIVSCDQRDVRVAEQAATAMLSLAQPPTAIFCANSRNTIGAYRALRTLHADVALCGFDDFELADMLGQPLTVVAYDPEAIGRHAASLLLERIKHSDGNGAAQQPRKVLLHTKLVHYGQL